VALEAVAGLLDAEGETAEEVARREAARKPISTRSALVPIQPILPASGSYDEVVWLFCGRVDARGAEGIFGLAAEQEDIRVVVKPLAEIELMLDTGQIDSAHTVIALYWLLRHRDRLRKQWTPG